MAVTVTSRKGKTVLEWVGGKEGHYYAWDECYTGSGKTIRDSDEKEVYESIELLPVVLPRSLINCLALSSMFS